ncbi:serine threonine protein phosphatase [Moniliophthora roreri MCA 2997]|uniref:Serine threonine protein phosphatase n=1 Tax=Moniliophthora roreri (strain MCA 2997) TaxID=1381753 RepID=V2YIH9_MONRO|nr:serine threonine protein phosphatase [Moniliophthora roreri MCA 2997]
MDVDRSSLVIRHQLRLENWGVTVTFKLFSPPLLTSFNLDLVTETQEEADNLLRQQKYESALDKYGEALKLDPKDPVLLANTALCHLKTKRYLVALLEAIDCVRIDPTYPQAHARLAEAYEALYQYSESVKWNAAANAIPSLINKIIALRAATNSTSFDDALASTPAAHLVNAYPCYWKATLIMLHIFSSDKTDIYPFTFLTTALLYDMRVFHLFDESWFQILFGIMGLENQFDGWTKLKVDDEFKTAVRQRLAQHGWEKTDKVLAITIEYVDNVILHNTF